MPVRGDVSRASLLLSFAHPRSSERHPTPPPPYTTHPSHLPSSSLLGRLAPRAKVTLHSWSMCFIPSLCASPTFFHAESSPALHPNPVFPANTPKPPSPAPRSPLVRCSPYAVVVPRATASPLSPLTPHPPLLFPNVRSSTGPSAGLLPSHPCVVSVLPLCTFRATRPLSPSAPLASTLTSCGVYCVIVRGNHYRITT
ncbi:hypothetical protein CRENBAI_025422 [Crenichthys baileyi]|uniref:Uncharacterized protein n=1 Tax=Crenichthys baileyi TaxID=28760 RepID=A0AAV9SQX6_9TELE